MTKVVYNNCFGGFSLSNEAVKLAQQYADADSPWQDVDPSFGYIHYENIERHDPILVRVVEELGDRADGMCADLTIEEINEPAYRIDEYDGNETVIVPNLDEWTFVNDNVKQQAIEQQKYIEEKE